MRDVLFVFGLTLIGVGIGMIYLPAAIIYAGIVLASIATMLEHNTQE